MKRYILELLLALLQGVAVVTTVAGLGVMSGDIDRFDTPVVQLSRQVPKPAIQPAIQPATPTASKVVPKTLSASQVKPNKRLTIGPVDVTIKAGDVVETKATYYAKRYENRLTASGEKFHESGDMAAFNRLPLGSIIRLTNSKTGQTVIARVCDRKLGESIDLSQNLFTSLGFTFRQGVGKISVTVISLGSRGSRGMKHSVHRTHIKRKGVTMKQLKQPKHHSVHPVTVIPADHASQTYHCIDCGKVLPERFMPDSHHVRWFCDRCLNHGAENKSKERD